MWSRGKLEVLRISTHQERGGVVSVRRPFSTAFSRRMATSVIAST